jgi:cell division protein ZapE
MHMTPEQRYLADLAHQRIQPDEQQARLVERLQNLYDSLCDRYRQDLPWWQRWLRILHPRSSQPIQGLYLWGSVGIGKTYLMDLFFQQLPLKHKLRLHFHDFMQQIHRQLQSLQGKADPLRHIAKRLASEAHVLCFDEFIVNDIGDAMILAGLLKELFTQNIVLVATSNTAPNHLYRNGLQRQRFLPAIKLITDHCDCVHVTSKRDYRLQYVLSSGTFFAPTDDTTEQKLRELFTLYTDNQTPTDTTITIANRQIEVIAHARHVVWFDFDIICNIPRSQQDYLAIARQFDVVIISNLHAIAPHETHRATHFINLIDILYDEKIELILASGVALADIYPAGELISVFQRTLSRLHEMQSASYLERCNQAVDKRK